MRKEKIIWDKVFDINYCPFHFWEKRKKPISELEPACPKDLVYCCFDCPEKKDCPREIRCDLGHGRSFACSTYWTLEAFEEALAKSESIAEFSEYLRFNKKGKIVKRKEN